MSSLTKEQFRAQFNVQVTLGDAVLQSLTLEDTIYEYPIYRCLDRLLLLDTDGHYYISERR